MQLHAWAGKIDLAAYQTNCQDPLSNSDVNLAVCCSGSCKQVQLLDMFNGAAREPNVTPGVSVLVAKRAPAITARKGAANVLW